MQTEKLNLTREWDKTFPKSEKVEHSKVTFVNRYGITLAADMYAPKDAQGNVLLHTKAFLYDCQNNLVRLPNGRTAVIKGLKDYVVAEEGEILMICPREDVAAMRKMHTDTKFS